MEPCKPAGAPLCTVLQFARGVVEGTGANTRCWTASRAHHPRPDCAGT
jgi:hypothetical protein